MPPGAIFTIEDYEDGIDGYRLGSATMWRDKEVLALGVPERHDCRSCSLCGPVHSSLCRRLA